MWIDFWGAEIARNVRTTSHPTEHLGQEIAHRGPGSSVRRLVMEEAFHAERINASVDGTVAGAAVDEQLPVGAPGARMQKKTAPEGAVCTVLNFDYALFALRRRRTIYASRDRLAGLQRQAAHLSNELWGTPPSAVSVEAPIY